MFNTLAITLRLLPLLFLPLLLTLRVPTIAGELPEVSNRPPVPTPHFPDTLHAVVWRNWGLVSPERLAKVLETNPEKITDLAASMGLPRQVLIPPAMHERGYITILRRNWHLLPYDQLLQLLDISEKELAFRLREDDFLYIKLGSLKPKCATVKYRETTAEARQREAEIRATVVKHFGDRLQQPAEPRFSFINQFAHGKPQPLPAEPAANKQLRFIYSYFATFGDSLLDPQLDPYPDGLLAQLQASGVNGVWLHTVLRQLAPGTKDFPEFGEDHETRLANLRKLVDRAKRFGIDVYLYVNEPRAMPAEFFKNRAELAGVREGNYAAMCTSDPRVRGWITDSLTHVFREVPGLGGVFTITASENLTNCASHGNQKACRHCAARSEAEIVSEVVGAIEEGVHRAAPHAKVIAYDWGWNGHGDATATIAKLPANVEVMSVSEWSLPIHRGGVLYTIGEYSISAVGPGPRATRHWNAAHERGLKTIAKVQLNNTWELSSVPYLPVLDLVGQHCERLATANVDGLMLSWSLGGYPSHNLELAHTIANQKTPDAASAIQTLANRHYGPKAAPLVSRAWTKFSQAFTEYPYSGDVLYLAPQQLGPANLLYIEPTGYSATMVGIPYDDLDRWRAPYPAQVFADQFQKVADGWADGLTDLAAAHPQIPANLQPAAAADLRVSRAAQLHFASVANQARFILARNELRSATAEKARAIRQTMSDLIDQETTLATQLFELSSADSRLGYEASNQYYYVPFDLVEKIINCEYIKNQLAK